MIWLALVLGAVIAGIYVYGRLIEADRRIEAILRDVLGDRR